jgi:hypothetical protein
MTAGLGPYDHSCCAAFIFGSAPGARVRSPQERTAILDQQLMAVASQGGRSRRAQPMQIGDVQSFVLGEEPRRDHRRRHTYRTVRIYATVDAHSPPACSP